MTAWTSDELTKVPNERKEQIDIMANVTQLKRSSPEAEGIPSAAVLDFIRAVEQHTHPLDAVQGFMLLRHGNVAFKVITFNITGKLQSFS